MWPFSWKGENRKQVVTTMMKSTAKKKKKKKKRKKKKKKIAVTHFDRSDRYSNNNVIIRLMKLKFLQK